jgi:hypothetical protein
MGSVRSRSDARFWEITNGLECVFRLEPPKCVVDHMHPIAAYRRRPQEYPRGLQCAPRGPWR